MWLLGSFSAFIFAVVIHAVSCRLPAGRNSVVKFRLIRQVRTS